MRETEGMQFRVSC